MISISLGSISCLALSPNNKFVIVGFKDGSLEIFSFEKSKREEEKENEKEEKEGKKLKVYQPWGKVFEGKKISFHESDYTLPFIANISILAVTEDSQYLIATSDSTLKTFNIIKREEVHTLSQVHDGLVI